MKISPGKKNSIHLRLSDEQFLFLLSKSEELGISISNLVRALIDSFRRGYEHEHKQID